MAKTMFSNLKVIAQNTRTDNIKMIDVDELHSSADNFFAVDRIEELADTISGQGGVKENLIVRPLESGGYEIISGHRRKAAVQLLLDRGENISRFLPCLVQNYSDEDSRMLDIVLMNISARQISDTEMWQSYEILNRILKSMQGSGERFGRIREKLAELLGVSAAQVGKMENVAHNAIPEIQEAVNSGAISISTANEIAKMDKAEQEKLVDRGIDNVSHKEIKRQNTAAKRATYSTNSEESSDISGERAICSTISDETSDDSGERAICSTISDEPAGTSRERAICSTISDEPAVDSGERDICSTISDEATDNSDERDICSTISNEQAVDSGERAICSTIADEPADTSGERAICSTISDESADDSGERTICSTIPDSLMSEVKQHQRAVADSNTAEKSLLSFVHEHYYDLETIFLTYANMSDDEEEIRLLEEFKELMKQSKEAARSKARYSL